MDLEPSPAGDRRYINSIRRKLDRLIHDPESGLVLGGPFLLSSGYYAHEFLDVRRLFDHPELSADWPGFLPAALRVLGTVVQFDVVVLDRTLALYFEASLSAALAAKGAHVTLLRVTPDGRLVNPAACAGRNTAVFTAMVSTGSTLRRISSEIGVNRGVAAAALTIVSTEDTPVVGTLIDLAPVEFVSQQNAHVVPTFSLLHYPIPTLTSVGELQHAIPELVIVWQSGAIVRGTVAPILTNVNTELKRYLAMHPASLYDLSSRAFEELIASILHDLGFEVELTRATRDGGRDICAYARNEACTFLTYVECKKYSPHRKVSVDIVRAVYGVQRLNRANKSLIVTTSTYTKPAIEEARRIEPEMELKDYESLKAWLGRYAAESRLL